jgi:hypothetical protein
MPLNFGFFCPPINEFRPLIMHKSVSFGADVDCVDEQEALAFIDAAFDWPCG